METDWNFCTPISGIKVAENTGRKERKKLFASEKKKPEEPALASRSIVDNESLVNLVDASAVCRCCHGQLELTLPTVCVASLPQLQCVNPNCELQTTKSVPSSTGIPQAGSWQTMTQYAINVLFVLSFIACGDGGVEAARFLGFLAIGKVASMAKSSFSDIERKLGPFLCLVAEAAMMQNMFAEVKQHNQHDPDFNFDRVEGCC